MNTFGATSVVNTYQRFFHLLPSAATAPTSRQMEQFRDAPTRLVKFQVITQRQYGTPEEQANHADYRSANHQPLQLIPRHRTQGNAAPARVWEAIQAMQQMFMRHSTRLGQTGQGFLEKKSADKPSCSLVWSLCFWILAAQYENYIGLNYYPAGSSCLRPWERCSSSHCVGWPMISTVR